MALHRGRHEYALRAAARVGGWVLSAFLLVVILCGNFIWSTMAGAHSELFARFLGVAALYWFVMEPLTVLVISASMQFCACCKDCCVGCGREPPEESAPSGGELHELPPCGGGANTGAI